MLGNLLKLGNIQVRDIMVPRADIVSININNNFEETLKIAAICGAVGGMAPDLDTFIRSANDSLLFIEYHRHFTHSLFFAPLGGLFVSLFLYIFFKNKLSFRNLYLHTTIGFSSHGLLDACTSYGTRLLWPFSDLRVSWNIISIIDPIYTTTLLFFFSFLFFS